MLYAATFGVYGVLTPFTPLILREMGLPDHHISLALSTFGLAAILSPLIISHFADRAFAVRQIITVLLIINMLILPLWLSATTLSVAASTTFLFFATMLPVLTLLDAFTVNFSIIDKESNHRARHYQSYRIWGSVGFMIPSISFALISRYTTVDSLVMVFAALILCAISIVLARLLPHNVPAKGSEAPSREALAAAMQPPLRGIFLATSIAGLALSMFYVIFPRFLQELGNSPEEVGLITNLGVLSEILLMPFTTLLIRYLTARTLILIGIASIPIRLLLITSWPSTEMVLYTQWLHGPLVIGLFICIPILLGESARHSFRFSLQSLNSTLVLGLSRMIGPWMGAFLLQIDSHSQLDNLRLTLNSAAALACVAFAVLYLSAKAPRGPSHTSQSR